MAKYRLKTKMFIEPNLYLPGTVIDYRGPPNIDMEPLDDDAKAALEIYLTENPHAHVRAVDGLPRTVGEEARASASMVTPAPRDNIDLSLAAIQRTSRPTPGPTEIGGTAVPPVVAPPTEDRGESGVGASSPSIPPDNPAMGNPQDPGGKGSENFEKMAEANLKAADSTKK